MTCSHCCGADKLFDLKGAQKEMKKFQKSGPSRVTKKLIHAISGFDKKDKNLLDIGGGIGAIAWHFHQNGASQITDVEASSGYLKVAREYAQSKGWEARANFMQGDFVDVTEELPEADFVTLDKVVCCYPDYQKILKNAAAKTRHILALTFPLGGPIAKIIRLVGVLYLKAIKNPYRPYVHPHQKMENLIINSGFRPVHQSIAFPWRVWVFERVSG